MARMLDAEGNHQRLREWGSFCLISKLLFFNCLSNNDDLSFYNQHLADLHVHRLICIYQRVYSW